MTRQSLPGDPTIGGLEKTAARSVAYAAPSVNLERPHAGKHDPRVAGIQRNVRAAGVFIREERPLPGFASIGRAKDAALLLWSIGVPERAGAHGVRVARIDDHTADPSGFI